jgi:hypothetical protein
MAKKKPKISASDVPPGMTLVKSRTYGDHLRAKRGTHKKVVLNAVLQKGTEHVGEANAAAKLIKDALGPYRKGLIDNTFWPNLLSMFRLQQINTGTVDFSELKPLEFHPRYTLHKLLGVQVGTSYDDSTRMLRAVVSYNSLPHFGKSRVDGYKLSAIVLFPDLKKKTAEIVIQESAVMPREKNQSPFDVAVSVPDGAECFVLCLRIDGCSEGKVYHTIATKGGRVVAAGKISRPGPLASARVSGG